MIKRDFKNKKKITNKNRLCIIYIYMVCNNVNTCTLVICSLWFDFYTDKRDGLSNVIRFKKTP